MRASYQGSCRKRLGNSTGKLLGITLDYWLKTKQNVQKPAEAFTLENVTHCNADFDKLWEAAKHDYFSCLLHNSEYLNWRIFDFPTCPLRISTLRDTKGTLRGYGIWHITEFSNSIQMAVLRDIFHPLNDKNAYNALLFLLIEMWREMGITWVSLEIASPTLTNLFYDLKFDHIPSRGNRYQIISKNPIDPAILQNWYRSGLDGDYFDLPL